MARATVLWTEPRQDAPDVIATLEAAGCEVQLGHPQEERDRPMSQEQLVAHADGLHAIMVGGRQAAWTSGGPE